MSAVTTRVFRSILGRRFPFVLVLSTGSEGIRFRAKSDDDSFCSTDLADQFRRFLDHELEIVRNA